MQEALQEMGGVQSIAGPSMHYFSGWGKKQWYERNPPHKLEQLEPLSWELPPETIGHLQDVEVFGFCVIHVDDVLYAGNNKFLNYFRSSMMNRFICKQPDRDSACYLGMQIDRLENGDLEVGSNGYEDQIEPIAVSRDRALDPNAELTEEEEKQFRTVLGKAMWLARITRADISFEVAAVAQCYSADAELPQHYESEEHVGSAEQGQPAGSTDHMPGFEEAAD